MNYRNEVPAQRREVGNRRHQRVQIYDTRRCCYRRHTSLLQDFRLLLSLPYRRHTSLLPGPLDTPTPGSSLEEGRPSVRTCTWGGSCRLAGREH